MSDLISSLLRFSRAGNESLELRPVDLNEIVEHVRADLSLQVEEAGADIQVDDLPVVEGDAGQIRQVFQNLIANAIKFRKPGEPAKVRVFADENLVMSDDGRSVHRITVSDEGVGFDDQYADRIFLPFQRLHTSEDYPGTGMGLAICFRIVERHGGRIDVQSRPGDGTSFFLELPAVQ
jgi:signal transduction histidine kinase